MRTERYTVARVVITVVAVVAWFALVIVLSNA
jgi:hypothetical protein